MILDLFAGAGGWDIAARMVGLPDPLGIEIDRYACETRCAAGLDTLQADLAELDPAIIGEPVDGIIASAPCQPWSDAGKRRGFDDPRGQLLFVPMRWIRHHRPLWVAFENVSRVLEHFQAEADELERLGYDTAVGILNAADFGVPQTVGAPF